MNGGVDLVRGDKFHPCFKYTNILHMSPFNPFIF